MAPAHALSAAVAAGARRLGSRLYFEFTGAALGDVAAWEGVADGVAVEVRRHGAPAPAVRPSVPTTPAVLAEVAALYGMGAAAPAPTAMVMAPTVLEAPAPARGDAAPAGVGASSVVHVDSHNIINNNNNNNFGNTMSSSTIVLL